MNKGAPPPKKKRKKHVKRRRATDLTFNLYKYSPWRAKSTAEEKERKKEKLYFQSNNPLSLQPAMAAELTTQERRRLLFEPLSAPSRPPLTPPSQERITLHLIKVTA